jgi:hypothetical protein
MQTSGLDADERTTLMASLLKAAKLKHRIVFCGEQNTGMLYSCWIEVPEGAVNDGWMKIDSLAVLCQYIAKYSR